ncbi:hypothetical protein RJ640_012100 [Escallonia rubra]|uniref:GBF-interacting protein 1 N-terminal domain-containing protein n=1 Tax=Escallonia rubra TaxID=112253 RepID=A0AA88UWN0_9ASTE|nr:hypothetical protein RJ640_012100 [Escallonia rubra]
MGGKSHGGAAAAVIPAGCRETVEGMKEIVDCSEQEIYSMLKECNMDPNDAVQRLLSQDTFHEVKRKRERRKEINDTQETVCRRNGSASTLGGRDGSEHNASSSNPLNVNPYDKRDNGSFVPSVASSSAYRVEESNLPQQTPSASSASALQLPWLPLSLFKLKQSDSSAASNRIQKRGTGQAISSSVKPSGDQRACFGTTGHVSMADVVKMGGPHGRAASILSLPSDTASPFDTAAQNLANINTQVSAPLEEAKMTSKPGSTASRTFSDKEWPSASGLPVLDVSFASETEIAVKTNFPSGRANQSISCQSNGGHIFKTDVDVGNPNTDRIGSVPASSRETIVDGNGSSSYFSSDSYQAFSSRGSYRHEEAVVIPVEKGARVGGGSNGGSNVSSNGSFSGELVPEENFLGIPCRESISYGVARLGKLNYLVTLFQPSWAGGCSHYVFQNHTAPFTDVCEAVSLAAADMKRVTLQEELVVHPKNDACVLVIPDHLKVSSADCSRLSFGTYRSATGSSFEPLGSGFGTNGSSVGHLDARHVPFFHMALIFLYLIIISVNILLCSRIECNDYEDHHLISLSGAHRAAVNSGNPELPSSPTPDFQDHSNLEATNGHHYMFSSYLSDYKLENSEKPNSAVSCAQEKQQMRNLSPFPGEMNTISNCLPGELMASAIHPVEESDIPFLPSLAKESIFSKRTPLSVSSPMSAFSVPEVLKPTGTVSRPLPTPQVLPRTAVPQHLRVNRSAQSSLASARRGDMFGYSSLPQDVTLSQAHQLSNSYHRYLAAVQTGVKNYNLPKYENLSSLPQYADNTYGYDGSRQGFLQRRFSSPESTSFVYDDFSRSRYDDRNGYQNDSPGLWVHGAVSRTIPAVRDSMNSLQGRNQPLARYQQGLPDSQHYGYLQSSNAYHSQIGSLQNFQQQSSNGGHYLGSQGRSSNQSHDIWQDIY